MSEADSPPIGTTAVDFDMGGLIAVRSPTLTPALPGVPGRTTTSGGGSITTARSGKPPISCAARLLRFANAWAIAEADAIGDPSLLRDGLTDRDRIALETYRDARAGMALIREAVEDCAPPGSVAREDYLTPDFTVQAEALVRGIYAVATRARRTSRSQSSE